MFTSKLKRRLSKIDDKKMYSPDEIFSLGVILNLKFQPSLDKVYRFIKRKLLPAVNMGTDVQPRWFVRGKDLREVVEKKYLSVK